jgi:hypothetical protein
VFRAASYANDRSPESSTWRCRDTIARFTDGTSNTIVIGEKQMYIGGSGGPAWLDFEPTEWNDHMFNVDSSWLTHGMSRSVNIYRPVHVWGVRGNINNQPIDELVGIQQRNEHRTPVDANPAGFGSWHAGTTNFVLGDGAVRGVSDSINPRILAILGIPNTGLTATIP